ncbi:MAG: UbiH/UbiF family hydroxylase [Roseiarcus sp.]
MDRAPDGTLSCEVLVVGAGLAGLVAAIGFARSGFDVALCGAPERLANGRTVALFDSSIRLLERLDLWPAVEAEAAPLRILRIIDDTGGLWTPPPIEFRSGEIGLDAFGWNVENARLLDVLARAARATPGLRLVEGRVEAYEFGDDLATARCQDGAMIRARLVAAADGRGSPARKAAGIDASTRAYRQSALTLILGHSRPHRDASTEFHTRSGPFTLVPLPDSPAGAARSSLVWLMANPPARRRAQLDDAALAAAIEAQCQSMLGRMRIEGGRGLFPMISQTAARPVGRRLALIGDAAHVFPPIGAQGLNLGLRDVAHLIEAASEARSERRDIGGAPALDRYADWRRPDVAIRTCAVNGLNSSLLAALPPIDLMRGLGLGALAAIGPLRRFVMREGVAPHWSTPTMMRPDAA